MVGEELSSCGKDGNEASSRVEPAGRGSVAHRGFSVHCNPERGGRTWAGFSSSLPLGKWCAFQRAVLEKSETGRKRDGFTVMGVCLCVCWVGKEGGS